MERPQQRPRHIITLHQIVRLKLDPEKEAIAVEGDFDPTYIYISATQFLGTFLFVQLT